MERLQIIGTIVTVFCLRHAQCMNDLVVRDLGCWLDTENRTVPSLDNHLDGDYTIRSDAIQKCAKLARGFGYTVFAIQNGGWCASGPRAKFTYRQYGPSTQCNANGKGGPWANQVYEIETVVSVRYKSIGCFGDQSTRAIPVIENHFIDLKGNYHTRSDAIAKCARSAAALGHRIFAVQNGGQCFSSTYAGATYKRYGSSTACLSGGKGGPWANNVYEIEQVQTISLTRRGCYKDNSSRALTDLEPLGALPGDYHTRPSAIEQCIRYVSSVHGRTIAGVQNGGQCMAGGVFNKFGISTACATHSKGGPWANEVFELSVE